MADENNSPNPLGGFFDNVRDRAPSIRGGIDKVTESLNNSDFLTNVGEQFGNVASAAGNFFGDIQNPFQTNTPGLDNITSNDLAPKPVGVRTIGTQSGQIIGNVPITVSSAGLLPIGLAEKRKKALQDAAKQKSKAIGDALQLGVDVDPRYDVQITNDYVQWAEQWASKPGFDPNDPKFRLENERRKSVARMFNNEDGISVQARDLLKQVEESAGDFILDREAYKFATDIAMGRISTEDIVSDPKAIKKLQAMDSRVRLESSNANIFKTNIKPNVTADIDSWFGKTDFNTLAAMTVEERSTASVSDERINEYIDNAFGDSLNDQKRDQLFKTTRAAIGKQVERKLKSISTGFSRSRTSSRIEKQPIKPKITDNTHITSDGRKVKSSMKTWETGGSKGQFGGGYLVTKNGRVVPIDGSIQGTSGDAYELDDASLLERVINQSSSLNSIESISRILVGDKITNTTLGSLIASKGSIALALEDMNDTEINDLYSVVSNTIKDNSERIRDRAYLDVKVDETFATGDIRQEYLSEMAKLKVLGINDDDLERKLRAARNGTSEGINEAEANSFEKIIKWVDEGKLFLKGDRVDMPLAANQTKLQNESKAGIEGISEVDIDLGDKALLGAMKNMSKNSTVANFFTELSNEIESRKSGSKPKQETQQQQSPQPQVEGLDSSQVSNNLKLINRQ